MTCGYALLAKVFPATLNAGDHYGRLRVPFSYWNATGLMAALGLPACLWAGARPGRRPRGSSARRSRDRGAAHGPDAVLLARRADRRASSVSACWFALVPLRLRATLLLALGAIGGAVATGWALAHHAITHDNATIAARTSAGHEFGVVLLAVLAVMAIVGLAAAYALDRIAPAEPVRRRIGTALIVLVAMVPVVAIAGVAASSRGLTGEISHVWNEVTSPNSHVGNNPGRIAELGNSRPLYWSEGLKVGEHALLAGAGAGGFDTARTRYSSSTLAVAHAHSYVIETFADFGLIGIAVSLGAARWRGRWRWRGRSGSGAAARAGAGDRDGAHARERRRRTSRTAPCTPRTAPVPTANGAGAHAANGAAAHAATRRVAPRPLRRTPPSAPA